VNAWQPFQRKHVCNKRWYSSAAFALTLVAANMPDLLAQCAMCKTVASAQSRQAMASLNYGILFLLVPPVAIMSGLLLFAFRCRNSPRLTQEPDASRGDEDVTSTAA